MECNAYIINASFTRLSKQVRKKYNISLKNKIKMWTLSKIIGNVNLIKIIFSKSKLFYKKTRDKMLIF